VTSFMDDPYHCREHFEVLLLSARAHGHDVLNLLDVSKVEKMDLSLIDVSLLYVQSNLS
jgi:hypothetical protein